MSDAMASRRVSDRHNDSHVGHDVRSWHNPIGLDIGFHNIFSLIFENNEIL